MTTKKLTSDSTVNELFEFFDVEGAVACVPITIQETPDDTRLVMLVRGEHDTASLLFAALMERIQELADLEAQQDALQDDEPRIITS